ncbi:MAG: plasmid stabilization protein [Rhizobiaceae bacterium]|nr:plasmid stabilization protein [Rhizobiaceae bacterium]
MGDLLLRGIDDALKKQLQENALRNGRSLSDEAIDLLRQSLSQRHGASHSAGQRLRVILGAEKLTEKELQAIAEFRRESDREPPRFE